MSEIKFWKGGNITSMTGNNIFVYGANPEFRNGFGSAKTARQFGAKPYGSGRGIVGNTFGLITKNLKAGYVEKATGIKYDLEGERSVSPEMIRANIDELYQCALENSDKKFFIAYMNNSRNLNGYSPKEMWDMFTDNKYVPENIRFHESFRVFLNQTNNLKKPAQQKRENMSKLKEAYEISKKSENVRTTTVNPNNGEVKSIPEHGVIDYNEAIKVDNQPRENFTFFWHSQSPFSQWHPSIFKVKDIEFTSAEQFMMFCKAKLFKDEEVANEILNLNHDADMSYIGGIYDSKPNNVLSRFCAGEITREEILNDKELKKEWDGFQKKTKELGRKVKNYDEATWVKHRVSYVAKGNYEKFTQNKDLQEVLINTGNTIMTEANPYDKVWACALKEYDPNATSPSKWKGQNLLGKILTNLREKLKYDLKQSQSLENYELQKKRKRLKP